MNEFMIEYFINMGVTALFMSIKNPDSKAKMKKISLKVYLTIKAAYSGDSDFN